jgi:hypothetical protein
MNKIYSVLFDIFAASLFMLSMWLMGRTEDKVIGLILFCVAMTLLSIGDSVWNTEPQPKNKTK